EEWRQSCVDDQLIRLNVTPLMGDAPSQHLLYADGLSRRNDGRLSEGLLQRYAHVANGGWWCSGIDVLSGETDLWGCFKPDRPRQDPENAKPIKYEHPPKVQTGIFALRVPRHLWERIAEKANVALTATDYDPDQPDGGFWQWLMTHPEVPLMITEGAKKAGALLTAGYAAIALPGVHNGYRTPRNGAGQRIGKSQLIPALAKLAHGQRHIFIAFDQDHKPKTIQQVNLAIQRLGFLLSQQRCHVQILQWDHRDGKGVDDLIAAQGSAYLDRLVEQALPLESWKAQRLNRLTYDQGQDINARYLPPLTIPPSEKFVAVRSPKGTGKTQFLAQIVAQAQAEQRPVLVIGHRIRLVQELCRRFGLPYVGDLVNRETAHHRGYGLCVDSLHPHSQAHFNPDQWRDCLIIIDEVEQVLWHALNADTCRHHRVAILRSLKQLLQNSLGGEGQLYVADADLTDVSLEYLIALSGIPLQPYVIRNQWQPGAAEAWPVYHFSETDPKQLVKHLLHHIREGGKPFVCLSAQKLSSAWGTRNLEAYLNKQFPSHKILRIDAESLADPSHPAHGSLTQLNQVLQNYDIVLTSPAVETGVSIDLKNHFTSVWGIAQGVQTATSVCQSLGRIRANVPRYLWVAGYGFNQVGNGATSIPKLLTSGHRLTELNIRLLQQSDLDNLDDWDTGFQAESLLCWAKMAVRVNASMLHYRESVLGLLQQEGHQLLGYPPPLPKPPIADPNFPVSTVAPQPLREAIEAVREQNYQADCQAIAACPRLTADQYQTLKKRLVKNSQERQQIRKYELAERYGIPVTPELVQKDDQGWYHKLRLHYFLTVGRPFLADRDAKIARLLINQGQGSLFLPDFNGSQLGAIIGTFDIIGIPILINHPQRELCPLDPDLVALAELAIANRGDIKTVVGIGLAKNASPITILRRFLDKLGFGLGLVKTRTVNKKRVRVYQITYPQDEREQIFQAWLQRDRQLPGSSEQWMADYWQKLRGDVPITKQPQPFVQLSLGF
ncbi:MAG: plasmid replication protein, CyRepA1 family, partial [Synechocystis sp.]|nr:plasmid replication protein, CyRepA1 family [Synechocystis sp.]